VDLKKEKQMSKTIGVFFILLSFSIVSYAITYLHVDGADETVITPPAYFTVTADLSSAGRMLVIEVYADENLNRNPDPYELGNYLGVIDGVPSIGWLADHIYIPGDDDSLADAQITHTAYMEEIFFPGTTDTVRMFLVATDAGDGSCDTALVHILPPSAGITPEPPYAYGHVYSSADSTPIAGAFCVPTDLDVVVFSDSSGRFAFHVPERDSSYQMTAIPADTIHGASATATFSFGASDDSVEADVYCPVYTNHVRGTVTIDGTTPIPGFIIIMGYGAGSAAAVADPATGAYSLPALPGTTYVFLIMDIGLPPGYFPVPSMQITYVPPGSDVEDIDFDLQPLDAAIAGTVFDSTTLGFGELEGLPLRASAPMYGEYRTVTDETGEYLLGVKGMPTGGYYLSIESFGYDVVPLDYTSIAVSPGDTVTDKNFTLFDPYATNMVSGIVTDGDGYTVMDAHVILYNEKIGHKKGWQHALTDTSGHYSFINIPPWTGEWFVGAYKTGEGEQDPRMIIIDEITIDTVITDADFVLGESGIPDYNPQTAGEFELGDVHPNPFNAVAGADLIVEVGSSDLAIAVYDMLGRRQRLLYRGPISPGKHTITIDCSGLASGVYFIKVTSGGRTIEKPLVLCK